MFRHVERMMFATVLACEAATAQAQTIGDYSRAQRSVIESAIVRGAVRPAAPGPLAMPPMAQHAPSAPLPTLPAASPMARASQADSAGPEVTVTGVVATPSKALVEVVVDGATYMLTAGQPIPGTLMTVAAVAADRVVLSGVSGNRTYLLANVGP